MRHTLIKWPGGKSGEFEYIKDLIPAHDRYVEPFFGGGAVFFQLEPKKAVINDVNTDLTTFYKFVKGQENKKIFKKTLYDYVDNWEKIPEYISFFQPKIVNWYDEFKKDKIKENELKKKVTDYLESREKEFNGLFNTDFCLDDKNLLRQIISNLVSKLIRVKKIEKERGLIGNLDLLKNIETAFRSGFYMHFRDVMNYNGSRFNTTLAKKVANYYFIREFCYASMFRFNAAGHFNIPYGGIGYNKKDFRRKVDYIFDKDVERLFMNTDIHNNDFEKVFSLIKPNSNDFIFLDPPYDTDFKDYEKSSFDKKDQIRLANSLYKIKAKFILIIKDTPFISSLYKNKKGINVISFEKTYMYNVKGRNNRDVDHLIIFNFNK